MKISAILPHSPQKAVANKLEFLYFSQVKILKYRRM